MSFKDFVFGKSSKLKPIPLQDIGQIRGRSEMLEAAKPGALERLRTAGDPYSGQLPGTVGASQYERQGLSTLGDYLESPLPTEDSLFAGARSELEKTFGGEYDPVGSTYYEAYKTAVMRELREAKERLAAETAASDSYFGGGRIKETSNLEEGATNTLALELGRLFERERERRLGAVPMAQSLLGFQEQAPLQRVAASQQYGSLPRMLEESGLSAEYGEYLRQMQEMNIPLEVAMNLATYKPEYAYKLYSHTPGLLGGPSGVSMQPTGGYGDPQRTQQMAKLIASIWAGGAGAGAAGGFAGALGGGIGGGMDAMGMGSLGSMFF